MNTGSPAFPQVDYKQPLEGGAHIMTIHGGMTLRDYFASKAIQGLLASTKVMDIRIIADDAYAIADAMLKARGA